MDHVELFKKLEGQNASIVMSTDNIDVVLEAKNIRISLDGAIMWENNAITVDWEQADIKAVEGGCIITINKTIFSIVILDAG